MQIAQVLAGYTLGAADILRRAMGKKKPEEMAKQREIFCKGAVNNGVDAEVASYIFDLMEKFAGYGFNKSHSASYALIAYQTAWLKTHYPAAFMAAVLSSDMDRTEKIILFLDECRAFKLDVSPPDVNKSYYFFNVLDDNHLMYGMGAIKGVGAAAIENIVLTREQGGEFTHLFDFCQRVDLHKMNRRTLEALIKSGCFDSLNQHRATLMASLNHALSQAEQRLHNQMVGQHDLLSMLSHANAPQTEKVEPWVEVAPWGDDTQLQGEKETLGFYLTGHPLNRHLNELAHFTTGRIAELRPASHKVVRVAGIVTNIRTRQTKRGDRIAIFTLDDGTTQIEVVCFSETLQKYRPLIMEDQLIVVEGEVSLDEFSNSARMVSRDLFTLEEARGRFAKYLQVGIKTLQQLDVQLLKQLLTSHLGGRCQVILRVLENNIQTDITLGQEWLIKPTETLLTMLQKQMVASFEIIY
jgi:DNA polymerase-3 subunit alpha